jgi:hypothetical protein
MVGATVDQHRDPALAPIDLNSHLVFINRSHFCHFHPRRAARRRRRRDATMLAGEQDE